MVLPTTEVRKAGRAAGFRASMVDIRLQFGTLHLRYLIIFLRKE